MKSLETVYFPRTDIYSTRQYSIFLLLPKINIIRPFEKQITSPAEEPPDSFINSEFCQVHTPSPLGENLTRFLHLVEDIRTRKDDYASQLSFLTLAAMTSNREKDEKSESLIIKEILTPKDLRKDREAQQREEKLWQARLVLAIGEILDKEEEDIATSMAFLEDEKATLFSKLHGYHDPSEEANPFAELLQIKNNLGADRPGNMEKRYNAWKHFFMESNLTSLNLFLTTSQDAGDQLIHQYEKVTNKSPLLLSGLKLPGLAGFSRKEATQAIHKFHTDSEELLSEITGYLVSLTDNSFIQKAGDDPTIFHQSLAAQWNENLAKVFPEGRFARTDISLYLFPGESCTELLASSDSGRESTAETTQESKNGLLAVVAL